MFFILLVHSGNCISIRMYLKLLVWVSYITIVSVVCFLFLFIEIWIIYCCRVVYGIKEKDCISMSANDFKSLHSRLGFWKYFRGFPSHCFPRNWPLLFSVTFLTSERALLWSSNTLCEFCCLLATSLYYFFNYDDDLQKGTHKSTHMKTPVMGSFHANVIYWELITENHKKNSWYWPS